LIEGCLSKWEAEVQRYESKRKTQVPAVSSSNVEEDIDYVLLARTVLENEKAKR